MALKIENHNGTIGVNVVEKLESAGIDYENPAETTDGPIQIICGTKEDAEFILWCLINAEAVNSLRESEPLKQEDIEESLTEQDGLWMIRGI